jgi:hypothetical protein
MDIYPSILLPRTKLVTRLSTLRCSMMRFFAVLALSSCDPASTSLPVSCCGLPSLPSGWRHIRPPPRGEAPVSRRNGPRKDSSGNYQTSHLASERAANPASAPPGHRHSRRAPLHVALAYSLPQLAEANLEEGDTMLVRERDSNGLC